MKNIHKSALTAAAEKVLEEVRNAGTYKSERVITTPQGVSISTTANPSKSVLNFCANNYLGLANHPEVVKAAQNAMSQYGFGMSSVRFICGTSTIHKTFEQRVSEFLGKEDTILYPSCFDANAGVFEALLTEQDMIISDELNHASIIDGVRLCKAERRRYKHLDMTNLEEELKSSRASKRLCLIVTDGVFSMDGDIAPLNQICDLAEKYNASVLVDDSHATGYFGPQGRGTAHYFGVQDRVEIVNSTLGKALGGASGGFSCGPKALVDLQRQKSRPYLFSNTVPPAVIAGSMRALEIASTDEAPRAALARNVTMFRKGMKELGFTVMGNESCAIVPVLLHDARISGDFAQRMLAHGIYVISFSFPVVPRGAARIRVQLSAAHSEDDIRRVLKAFGEVKKEVAEAGTGAKL
jgi:glycine C-acetyltransferase